MRRTVSADRLAEYRIRPAAVEQNSMSPSRPSHVGSKYGGTKPPRPAPPPRSPKTMLTTVPCRAEKSEQHPSCSPQQKDEDHGRYVRLGFADSQPQKLPRANPRRSASLRRPGLPMPHPALPDSDAQSCPSPSMKAPASPQEGAGHRQQQQMQPAMAASARRTEIRDDAEVPSTFYMTRESSSMPRAGSRWAKSLLYDGDPVNSSKPESAVAESGNPVGRLMIIDSRMDRYEDIDEFVVPPAPQRPPRRRKGSGSQQETQKQASSTASLKTGGQLNQSSSTASQSNESPTNDPLPVPKPRHSRKGKSKSTKTISPPITAPTATTNGIKDSHDPARQTPIPPPRTYKEKPARPPPPTAPTRKYRPPPPVPLETKVSVSQTLSSPACADGSTSATNTTAGSTNLYKPVATDVTGQPSISPEPNDDPDYAYIDIRNARKLLRARERKHPLLGDSDSDGEVENVGNSGFYMPLERSTLLADHNEYAQVTYDTRLQRSVDGGLEGHSVPVASSGIYSSLTTTTMVTERASTYQSPSELKKKAVLGRSWSKS